MCAPIEYEFVLPDGSKRYEIVFRPDEVFAFRHMFGAVSARPLPPSSCKVRRDW